MAVSADDKEGIGRIDPMALDTEWLGLASVYNHYGEVAADAILEKDQAEKDLKRLYAELVLRIRTNPDMWPKVLGVDKKPTEGAIDAWVLTRSEYQEAQDRFHQARHTAKLAANNVDTIDKKDRSLEWLTKLFFNGYFVGPKIPKELDRQFLRDAAAAQTEEAQRRSLQRRRRKKGDGDE